MRGTAFTIAGLLVLSGCGGSTDASAGAAAAPPITLEGRLDQLDRIIRGEAP